MTAEAGKDAYCEKPWAMFSKRSRRRVMRSLPGISSFRLALKHRSEPYQIAVRDLIRSGVLVKSANMKLSGTITDPRWRGRPEVKMIREHRHRLGRMADEQTQPAVRSPLYCEFRLYKEFSSGISDHG